MKPLLFTIAAIVVAPLALAGASTQGLPSTQKPPSAASVTADPRAVVASKVPGTSPEDVHATPVPGLFEIMRGTDAAYVTADGKYAIAGDLYDLHTNVDLTENQRRATRVRLLSAIPESQMVIFGPKDARHTVTVFTDVDCAYCRKFHSQIADYNRMGIRVRYVFYPRTGPNTESWTKAEQVWCSSDRHAALTRAKLGEPLSARVCATNPVAREYALGQAIGLEGTPGIVAANGALVGGYLPPKALLAALKDSAQPPTAAPAN